MRPVSLYGRHKVELEKAVLDRGQCDQLSARHRVRYVAPDAARSARQRFRSPRRHRSRRHPVRGPFQAQLLHVHDVTRAFLDGLDHFDELKNEPYNVGLSDANLSKRELCGRIQRQVPQFGFVEAPIGKDPDQRDYIVSNEKIERTGFRTQYSLDAGIAELVKGCRMLRNAVYGNV
jgi:nucleoside-diphosphate-sugar epimerase